MAAQSGLLSIPTELQLMFIRQVIPEATRKTSLLCHTRLIFTWDEDTGEMMGQGKATDSDIVDVMTRERGLFASCRVLRLLALNELFALKELQVRFIDTLPRHPEFITVFIRPHLHHIRDLRCTIRNEAFSRAFQNEYALLGQHLERLKITLDYRGYEKGLLERLCDKKTCATTRLVTFEYSNPQLLFESPQYQWILA